MGTSRADIGDWFDRGVKQKATYMIVVCDTFSWEDYPVFVSPTSERSVTVEVAAYDGSNMQKVMEVYDLRQPKEDQLDQRRVRADLAAT